MKRWLYLGHRWLGIALCLVMALWFLSGVVMMYVGYPKLTAEERLAPLPALAADCCVAPAALPLTAPPLALRLSSVAGEPVYVATLAGNRVAAFDGRSGAPKFTVDADLATKSAASFLPGVAATYVGLVEEDAWTHSRALDPHRPLHRVDLADGRALYVSSQSGEVVRDATRVERYWNWLGAWLHWLYPLRGGAIDAWWREIVVYASLAATVLAVSGLWVGCLRWRRRPYANGSRSPYRSAWARWHHWLGLFGGVLVVAWIASGLLSMNPWRLFDAGAVRPERPVVPLTTASPASALACLQTAGFAPRELAWLRLGGADYVLAQAAAGDSRLLRDGVCAPEAMLTMATLRSIGETLLPASAVLDAEALTAYDAYYYARAGHSMSGHLPRPLPVLRLRFDDPAQTWLYLDPRSGAVVHRLDSHTRVKRWLFALLHSWDWLPLLERRPLWDVLMVLGSLAGFALSLSGVVLGWRRLVRA